MYDVHPQTGRFLIVKNDIVVDESGAGEPHLNVVLNWFEELKGAGADGTVVPKVSGFP